MVLEATVDPNILSYSVPIIMRGRGEVDRWDKTNLWTSGEAKSALGGRERQSLSLSPWARRSWPLSLGRDRAQPSGVGRGRV